MDLFSKQLPQASFLALAWGGGGGYGLRSPVTGRETGSGQVVSQRAEQAASFSPVSASTWKPNAINVFQNLLWLIGALPSPSVTTAGAGDWPGWSVCFHCLKDMMLPLG